MDMRLAPHAVAMTSAEFTTWSSEVMEQLLKYTGAKKAVDKITGPIWSWAMRNSTMPLHFGIACCALEMAAAWAPRFDLERLGILPRSSPRQCEVLIVNGWITAKLRPDLRRLYEQMSEPKWVLVMGECAISGGPWYDSHNTIQGCDTFIPVDIYIPGCPPRPEAMIDGFIKLQKKMHTDLKKGTFLED